MTREEEINKVAIEYGEFVTQDNLRRQVAGYDFAKGAKWADENPTWISVKEDLPCNHEELLRNENYTKSVLVVLSWNEDPTHRYIDISDMSNVIGSHNVSFYWRCDGYYTVTHWSRLPELPKE